MKLRPAENTKTQYRSRYAERFSPEQVVCSVQATGPPSPRVLQEGGVEAGLWILLSFDDEAFDLVDDVPAAQGRVVLHRPHPGDQSVVNIGLKLGRVRDQSTQASA